MTTFVWILNWNVHPHLFPHLPFSCVTQLSHSLSESFSILLWLTKVICVFGYLFVCSKAGVSNSLQYQYDFLLFIAVTSAPAGYLVSMHKETRRPNRTCGHVAYSLPSPHRHASASLNSAKVFANHIWKYNACISHVVATWYMMQYRLHVIMWFVLI